MKSFIGIGVFLVLLSCASCTADRHDRAAQAGRPASSPTRVVTVGGTVTSQDFCSQLKHDGALDAAIDKQGYVVYTIDTNAIDKQGYVVYTIDTKMDQVRPGDAARLARTVLDKAEASGVKVAGCRVVDEFTGQVVAQCAP